MHKNGFVSLSPGFNKQFFSQYESKILFGTQSLVGENFNKLEDDTYFQETATWIMSVPTIFDPIRQIRSIR
ncbi:MAG TPA: hypothetical protein DIW81_11895 [Planctomycetaceae bacterium]|nr:hypothetical protein [Planctomycetaceae bacterium]